MVVCYVINKDILSKTKLKKITIEVNFRRRKWIGYTQKERRRSLPGGIDMGKNNLAKNRRKRKTIYRVENMD